MKRIILTLLLAVFGAGCAVDERWNVLVVTFDTTRADHIGCYGNQAASTPVLDRLAAEGTLFAHAIAPAPITLPSHSSLMTGKVPFGHGVRDNGLFSLGEDQTTLAEILAAQGYRTAAAVGSFPLTSQFGIGQGFEFYDDLVGAKYEDVYGERVFPKEQLFFDERPAARVNDAILPWLEENGHSPFFLWVHYFDPHHPHQPPPPFNQLFVHDLYSGEIAYADESLGTLLGHLERLGVLDRTLVVFTSDHGEGIGEHRESTHSLLIYDSTLHVPLIIRVPGGETGSRVHERVGLVDVAPTVLDLLGLPLPDDIQGQSLRPLLEPGGSSGFEPAPIYAETLSPRLTRGWGELRALFLGDHKYIHGPRPELFDVQKDPRELTNLIDTDPDLTAALRGRLESYLAEHAVAGIDSSVDVDEETARRLAALGYLQNAGHAVGVIEERLRDDGEAPQDHAGMVSAFSQAKQLLFRDRPIEASDFILGLLETDPGNPEYLELLANAEAKMGRSDRAVEILEGVIEDGVQYGRETEVLRTLVGILLASGELDAAYGRLREAEALEETPLGHYRLAKLHEERGEDLEQLRYLKHALELEPTFVPARINIGIWYALHGDPVEAERHLIQAGDDHPYHERVFFNYGIFLAQNHRLDEALAHLGRAVELNPNYLRARGAMIEIQFDLGDLDAALREYEALAKIAHSSAQARQARLLLEINE